MEYIAIFILMVLYQWLFLPILKRKIGYVRDQDTLFYQYKTKWQLPFELAVIAVVVLSVLFFTPQLALWSVIFVPIGFVAIFVMRGILEKKYAAYLRHHIISFVQAFAIVLAFTSIFIYSMLMR